MGKEKRGTKGREDGPRSDVGVRDRIRHSRWAFPEVRWQLRWCSRSTAPRVGCGRGRGAAEGLPGACLCLCFLRAFRPLTGPFPSPRPHCQFPRISQGPCVSNDLRSHHQPWLTMLKSQFPNTGHHQGPKPGSLAFTERSSVATHVSSTIKCKGFNYVSVALAATQNDF